MVRLSTLALAVASLAGGAPAFAQTASPAASPTEIVARPNPDADRLASEIRVLAANPRNLESLLNAAELSARLGDTSAANAFLSRAEAVEPNDPRIAAVRGATLVRLERPGEALRMFQQAEGQGAPMAGYLADRAFAYDLVGQPGLAQRDYKAALARDPDDEVLRRYALSLGIAGKQEEAMAALDPLLRRSDRAAWRARAFILAMNGDPDGAQRIASSMMPGNMGMALTPFFRRLEIMSPADRAFAVHFGELRPTPSRIADARLTPPMAAFVPEAKPPVQVAAAPPQPAARPDRNDRNSRRSRRGRDAVQVAAVAPVPAPLPAASEPPLPAPPVYRQPPQPIVQPIPAASDTQMTARERVVVPEPAPPVSRPAPVQLASRGPARPFQPPVRTEPAPVPVPVRPEPAPLPVRTDPVPPPREPVAEAPRPVTPVPAETPPPAPVEPAPQPRPEPIRVPERRIGQEDSAIAAIVNNLTIPASELGVNPMPGEPAAEAPRPVPPPAPEPETPAPEKPAPEPVRPAAKPVKPAAKPAPADAKGKPAPADAKGKKKPEPAKPKVPPEPSRIWVQVAGGANETTLATSWKKLVKQAPAAFKGRTPWTTPLRATNRVLAGPFKSSAEAQGFVNQLSKADISAFVFTSEAGQKITRLTIK